MKHESKLEPLQSQGAPHERKKLSSSKQKIDVCYCIANWTRKILFPILTRSQLEKQLAQHARQVGNFSYVDPTLS